jgi:hypothetical protein
LHGENLTQRRSDAKSVVPPEFLCAFAPLRKNLFMIQKIENNTAPSLNRDAALQVGSRGAKVI